MKLGALFQGIPVLETHNWDPGRTVPKITSDSRTVESGDLFIAYAGARMDGHDFLGQAILAKAGVIVYETLPEIRLPKNVTAIQVADSHACLAQILNRFHGYPDRHVKMTGVTGTNGKTTISYLLHRLLREKVRAAYLGTLWYELQGEKMPAVNTTPGPEILIPLLSQMSNAQVEHCVMEVSSHALHQRRINSLNFELAIFTQLTQDHLDYHMSLEDYFQSKRLFFTQEPQPRQMLINRDCPYGRRLLEENPRAKSFGLDGPADYQATDLEVSFQGSHFKMRCKGREIPVQIRLPLRHNVSNVLAVMAAVDMLGYDPEDFRGFLAEITGIPGRMERVAGSEAFQVLVDYAHTPDAIENVLREAQKLKPNRILTLFGCGGDRDRGKRPLMAQAACRYSDIVVLTSDNPRSEDPQAILNEIKKGLPHSGHQPALHEVIDRREAIDKIISLAEPGDVVFLLGKGHEDYQIVGREKIPFDDRRVAEECLKRKTRVFLS